MRRGFTYDDIGVDVTLAIVEKKELTSGFRVSLVVTNTHATPRGSMSNATDALQASMPAMSSRPL